MVYYIVLQPASEQYAGGIPCLLFSRPRSNETDSQIAELLPLRMMSSRTNSEDVTLSPLLLHKNKKCLFQEGCTFKIKAIKSGRRVNRKQRPWQYNDLDRWGMMHSLLRRLICLDISQMPKYMPKQLTPLLVAQQVTQNTTGRRRKSFLSLLLNKKRGEVGVPVKKLSHLHPTLRLHGLSTKGLSSFAEWFKVIPPDTYVDKEFTCDRNTKLSKDNFRYSFEFDEYLNISAMII